MKYHLTTSPAGMILQTAPEFTPPLGLLLPAKQDVKCVISTSILGSLITTSSPELPDGFELHTATQNYIYVEGQWLNQTDEQPAGTDVISGVIFFRNNAAYDIGITW